MKAKKKYLHDDAMEKLKELNPVCYDYLSKIPLSLWATYPLVEEGVALMNINESNIVEQEFFRFIRRKIRFTDPFHCFYRLMELWGDLVEEANTIVRDLEDSGDLLTPYAREQHNLIFKQSQALTEGASKGSAQMYRDVINSVAPKSDGTVKTWAYRVDYKKKECRCLNWGQNRRICSHGLRHRNDRKFHRSDKQFYKFAYDSCWLAKTYIKCYKDSVIEIPDDDIVPDKTVKPPKYVKRKAGRPKVKRYKSASEGGTKLSKKSAKEKRKRIANLYASGYPDWDSEDSVSIDSDESFFDGDDEYAIDGLASRDKRAESTFLQFDAESDNGMEIISSHPVISKESFAVVVPEKATAQSPAVDYAKKKRHVKDKTIERVENPSSVKKMKQSEKAEIGSICSSSDSVNIFGRMLSSASNWYDSFFGSACSSTSSSARETNK